MIEWFENIWEWIISNRDNIVTFISSTDFAATLAAVFALFKWNKSTKRNTLSIDDVNGTMKRQQSIEGDVLDTKTEVHDVNSKVDVVREEVLDCLSKTELIESRLNQLTDELMTKLNAMLEVQNIVYATIKDDAIRNAVNSVIVSAKHSDANSKIKLQEELDKLRDELKTKNAELDAAVSKVVEKVVAEVPATTASTPKKKIRRY